MEEVWKDIKGYEGLYQVSNTGRVKRIGKYKNQFNAEWESNRCLKMGKDKDGYNLVHLSKNGTVKCKKVHRLVAEAFIKNPKNYEMINHKNEIKDDNRVENLEWCDVTYNNNYKSARTRKYKKVEMLSLDGKILKEYESILKASIENNLDKSHIVKCCKGKIKTTGGYKWRYKED